MISIKNMPTPSQAAQDAINTCSVRIAGPSAAMRLWEQKLTLQDQQRLGGDLQKAYDRYGTVGMWKKLRGVSCARAIVEVGKKLNLLAEEDLEWLLRETGEIRDVEETISIAIESGALVLTERPREAYWKGRQIEIDWYTYARSWNVFYAFARHAKKGEAIDRFVFGRDVHVDFVAKAKCRLVKLDNFPADLKKRIVPQGRGTQQLKLMPEQIHIFGIDSIETLSEWLP